jgi:hypothetical protein
MFLQSLLRPERRSGTAGYAARTVDPVSVGAVGPREKIYWGSESDADAEFIYILSALGGRKPF